MKMNEAVLKRAKPEERSEYVVRPYEEIPVTELLKGCDSHLVSTEGMTISFLTMKANEIFDLHTHPQEQFMIVLEGYCDEVVEDKMYRLEKGDAIYLPPNIIHGAIVRETDCKVIDLFSPRREDYMEKFRTQHSKVSSKFR